MSAYGEATGDALGDTIGGMFDIPEMDLEGQMADGFTIGDDGKQDKPTEEAYDPFAGW
jgi:hypothetical protein